jgi:hypothetical protein
MAASNTRHNIVSGHSKIGSRCPPWVITGKARHEHLMSGVTLKADMSADIV